jgi:glutamine amidotransferase-like uncharacterized protein
MFESVLRVILRPGMYGQYQHSWKTMATHMTSNQGAFSSHLYYNSRQNSCMIHSRWPSQPMQQASWPLSDDAPKALKRTMGLMKSLSAGSVDTGTPITVLNPCEKQDLLLSGSQFCHMSSVFARKKNILIYNDEGAGSRSVEETYNRLVTTVDEATTRVLVVNADYVVACDWQKDTALFVMPGGRARPYYTALAAKWMEEEVPKGQQRRLQDIGVGNTKIKEMVEKHGGSYFGICAGAYYGVAETVFESGGRHEILDPGALNFYEGVAQGPAYGLNRFEYNSEAGSQLARLSSEKFATAGIRSYFNGGCYFPSDGGTSSEVLATYDGLEDGRNAAVVGVTCGKGRAVLSGAHIEYSASAFGITAAVRKELLESPQPRELFFIKILDYLGVSLSVAASLKIATQQIQREASLKAVEGATFFNKAEQMEVVPEDASTNQKKDM